jgi:hypothetical protein
MRAGQRQCGIHIKAAALHQLTCDLVQFNIVVAVITETWFSSQHPDTLLQIDSYQLYRRDRTGKKGGGDAIFVRNNISTQPPCIVLSCPE